MRCLKHVSSDWNVDELLTNKSGKGKALKLKSNACSVGEMAYCTTDD